VSRLPFKFSLAIAFLLIPSTSEKYPIIIIFPSDPVSNDVTRLFAVQLKVLSRVPLLFNLTKYFVGKPVVEKLQAPIFCHQAIISCH
jgi:hypothetical protein